MLQQAKAGRQTISDTEFSDEILDLNKVNENTLINEMIRASIEKMGYTDCLVYDSNEVKLNKRVLFMLSYSEYQKQYYYWHDKLVQELENRMCVDISIVEGTTSKTKIKAKKTDKIWDGLEDIRSLIIKNCSAELCEGIIKGHNSYTKYSKRYRAVLEEIREHEQILEMVQELKDSGIDDKYVLEILTKAETKKDITKFKNYYYIITMDKSLLKMGDIDIKQVPVFTDEQRMQTAVYFYLNEKGQMTYMLKLKVNKNNTKEDRDRLINEIIEYYKQVYPDARKKYTVTQTRSLILKMYCIKDKNECSIRNILKTNINNIFK